jgi:PadR family transcriptional regulator, regulatory protein PadR
MGRGKHLGELEALVLTAVIAARHGANGAAIYEEIEARSGRNVSLPAIHVTLRRLEAKGLLVSETAEPSPRGGRSRRFYQLTAEGARALREFGTMWRNLWKGLELPDPETLS